jgi:hypothetical protein
VKHCGVPADVLRKAMSPSMRCLSGEICLVIGVLPLKRSAHCIGLFEQAGFSLRRVIPTSSPVSIIEAAPKADHP